MTLLLRGFGSIQRGSDVSTGQSSISEAFLERLVPPFIHSSSPSRIISALPLTSPISANQSGPADTMYLPSSYSSITILGVSTAAFCFVEGYNATKSLLATSRQASQVSSAIITTNTTQYCITRVDKSQYCKRHNERNEQYCGFVKEHS